VGLIMDLVTLFIIFFSLVIIIVRRVKAMQQEQQSWIAAAYTKPNLHQYAGYWQWPKSSKV